MSDWKDYPNDRLIRQHELGFYIIKPKNDEPVIPIACPVCSSLMRTSDDEMSYGRNKCCNFCSLKWADARSEAWSSGWRPSKEEITDAIANRPPLRLFND